MRIRSNVTDSPAAEPAAAAKHFAARLCYEADCADVGGDIAAGATGFVVLDCRSPELYAAAHIPGAVNIPHRRITAETVDELLPRDALVVTYCNGPHCNASTRGALRLASLGRRVKEMPGGMMGWAAENLPVETGLTTSAAASSR
jgi:rhodanese-related sulfurtransferase